MRPVLRLATSLSLSYLAIAMASAAGPSAFVQVSGDARLAGAFFGTHSLFTAIGAALGGRAMDTFGRRRVLGIAHVVAGTGYLVVGVAAAFQILALLFAGVAVLALGIGTVYLTRVAAADLAPAGARGDAVARSQVGATIGAIVGPFFLLLGIPLAHILGLDASAAAWFLLPGIFLFNAALVLRTTPLDDVTGSAATRPVAGPPREPIPILPLAAAIGALVAAQAVMTATMGIGVVDMGHHGVTPAVSALVVSLHFVGMFAFSIPIGRLADRMGRRATIITGLVLIIASGAAFGIGGRTAITLGLLGTGIGWSFAYIGGTVLLTDLVPASRRGRLVGAADFTSAGSAAVASFAAGAAYGVGLLPWVGLAVVALALVPLLLALRIRPSPEPTPTATTGAA